MLEKDEYKYGSWLIKSCSDKILQSKCVCPPPKTESEKVGSEEKGPSGVKSDKLCRLCSFEERVPNLHHLPDMVFDSNYLQLEHENGTVLKFTALDALKRVKDEKSQKPDDIIQVACSQEWFQSRSNMPESKRKIVTSDWTYTTDYWGSIDESDKVRIEETSEPIDMALLQRKEEILYYNEIPLYEDELHDHGEVHCRVKIRVMPSCLFILLRFFMRVDDVLVRLRDTRYFHRTGSQYLIREYQEKEDLCSNIKIAPAQFRDPNTVSPLLKTVTTKLQKLSVLPEFELKKQ